MAQGAEEDLMENFRVYVNDNEVSDAGDEPLTAAATVKAMLVGREPGSKGRVDRLAHPERRGAHAYETSRSWVVDIDGSVVELPIVLFAPCSVDDKSHEDRPIVVVRRPAMYSYTGKAIGNVDERLGIAVEAYAADGPRECIGLDEHEQPIYGKRAPIRTQIVWCTKDERDQWDRGTGGEPGKPHSGSSNPVTAYVTADAAALEEAIAFAKGALTPLPPDVARLAREIAPRLRERMLADKARLQ